MQVQIRKMLDPLFFNVNLVIWFVIIPSFLFPYYSIVFFYTTLCISFNVTVLTNYTIIFKIFDEIDLFSIFLKIVFKYEFE